MKWSSLQKRNILRGGRGKKNREGGGKKNEKM